MSWGERSCRYLQGDEDCPNPNQVLSTCNVDCKYYRSNGGTPDSERKASQVGMTMSTQCKFAYTLNPYEKFKYGNLTKNQKKKIRQRRKK